MRSLVHGSILILSSTYGGSIASVLSNLDVFVRLFEVDGSSGYMR